VSRRALIAIVGLLLAAGGCADADEPELPALPGTTSGSASPGTEETAAATPASGPIPEFCDEVVPFTEVVRIVAVPIAGGTSRTYATDFSAESGRTARLTCLYGVQPAPAGGTAPPPQVEISLSSYVDAAAANARLEDTVGSARSSGQQVEAQTGTNHQAFLLADAAATTYVAAIGDRTVVVTLARGVVPAPAERVVLLGLAGAVLGVPVATPSPVPSPTTT
jgi:hypothetical protein